MRCPDCNKFAAYDTDQEPEEEDCAQLAEDGTFTASYRRVLTCADCGTELKEATIEFDTCLDFDISPCAKNKDEDKAHEWELTDTSASPTTRTQTTDKKGRRIKSARYMKSFYGVEVEVSATCKLCKVEASETLSDDVQASSMDECC